MIVLIFVIAVAAVVTYLLSSSINDALAASPIDQGGKDLFREQNDRFDNVFDYGILTLFIGVVIALLVTSYVLQTNPGLFFLVLIVVTIFGGISGYLSNAYETMTNDAVLGATAANFPVTNFLMANYMVLIIIVIFLMLIVFFAKPNDGGGY
jgi:hypothetical protein